MITSAELRTLFTGDTSGLDEATKRAERGIDDADRRLSAKAAKIGTNIGKGISSGLDIALGDVGGFVDAAEGLLSAGLKAIPGIGAGLSAAFDQVQGVLNSSLSRGFRFNDEIKQLSVELELVTGNATTAKDELRAISEISFSRGLGKGALAEAVQNLQLFNVEGGRALSLVKGLANQAVATGGDEGRVLNVTELLTRILETGKLDTRAVRQLIRQKIPLYDIIAQELDVSKQDAMGLIKRGALSGDDLVTILTSSFNKEKYVKAADDFIRTVEGKGKQLTQSQNRLLGMATKEAHDAAVNAIGGLVEDYRGPMANSIAASAQVALSPVVALLDATTKALKGGDIFGGALSAGESIISGLKQGITSRTGDALDAIKGLIGTIESDGSSILGAAADALGTHSPSKEFEQLGIFSALGYAKGILEGQDAANSATWQMMRGVLDTARKEAERQRLEQAANNPIVQNFFELIRQGEGGKPNVMAGGRMVNSGALHPGEVVPMSDWYKGPKGPSSAAGDWQITRTNWRRLAPELGLDNFSDLKQQLIAAIKLYEEAAAAKGHPDALSDLMQGNIKGALVGAQPWASAPSSTLPGRKMFSAQEFIAKLQSMVRSGASFNFGSSATPAPSGDIHMAMSSTDRANQKAYAEQMIAILSGGSFQHNNPVAQSLTGSNPSFEDFLKQAAPSLATFKSMTEEALKLGGAWDDTNKVLNDAGGIFVDVKSDADLLTTSLEGINHTAPLKPLLGEFDTLGNLITGDTQKMDQLGDTTDASLKKIKDRVHGLGQQLKDAGLDWQSAEQNFESAFGDAFHHVGDGWKATVRTFVVDFAQAELDMVVKAEGVKLADKLFGDATGKGGLLPKLADKILGVFGVHTSKDAAGGQDPALTHHTVAMEAHTRALLAASGGASGKGDNSIMGIARRKLEQLLHPDKASDGGWNSVKDAANKAVGDVTTNADRNAQSVKSAIGNASTQTNSILHELGNTLEMLIPHQQSFLQGLLGAVVSGAISGAVGSIGDGGGGSNDEGSVGPKPTTPPILKPGHMLGGDFGPNEIFPVGEDGPEWVRSNGRGGGTVIPNAATMYHQNQMATHGGQEARGGDTHNYTININVPHGTPVNRQSGEQMARGLLDKLQHTQRRG